MNFEKNFSTYDENAIVQKEVAIKLANFMVENIEGKSFDNILELGCGTGLFTKEILKKYKIKELNLNDYYNTKNYFKDINYKNFIVGDMLGITNNKYDMIISSSSFQWIKDFEKLIRNISQQTNRLAFSMYVDGNFKEIKEYFGMVIEYKKRDEITEILKKYFKKVEIFSEKKVINFETPMSALRHIKKTGVCIASKTSIQKIKNYKNNKLTYSVGYFICEK